MSYYEYHVARRYVQFEGALRELPKYAALVGKKVLLLTACDPVREAVVAKIGEGLAMPAAEITNEPLAKDYPRYAQYIPMADRIDSLRRDMEFEFYDIGDMFVSEANIRRVANYVSERGFDTVAGIGGGRGQDFVRALTHFVPVKVILVPTLAATNASISTLSVIYSSDGSRLESYWRMDNAPDLVLVDTELLIQNKPSVLSAGIGDIVSTYYEALCNVRISRRDVPPMSHRGVELAIDVMRNQVDGAMRAVREKKMTPAFESTISMIMHNCGPLWMICSVGFAHILDEIFLHFDATHRIPHGLRVGYATIPMLRFARMPEDETQKYIDFCHRAEIPTTLAQLGLSGISRMAWKHAVEETVCISGTYHTLPFAVTKDELVDCLAAAQ